MGKDLEGSDRGLIEALSRNLSGWSEETPKKRQSVYLLSRPRFEQRTSLIRAKNVTATPTRSGGGRGGGRGGGAPGRPRGGGAREAE
jgi:hypothetical protein